MKDDQPKFIICIFDEDKDSDEFIYFYNINDAMVEYETRKVVAEYKKQGEVTLAEVMSYYNPYNNE